VAFKHRLSVKLRPYFYVRARTPRAFIGVAMGDFGCSPPELALRSACLPPKAGPALATDCGIYAYDAYVLQCARTLSHPLLTLDARMRQVAAELKINILDQAV
jgi:hypothetical protein